MSLRLNGASLHTRLRPDRQPAHRASPPRQPVAPGWPTRILVDAGNPVRHASAPPLDPAGPDTWTGGRPPASRPGWPAATGCAPRRRAPARVPTSASTVPASAPTPATWPSSPPSASTPGPWPPTPTLAAGAPKRTCTTARRATRRSHRPGRMTCQRIRQVEQANLHPVDGSLGVFGQVGQLLPRHVLAAKERLLVESTQHLLLQRLGRVGLRPQQHPSEFVNRYRWLLRHDPGLPDASPAERREAGSVGVSLRRRDHASPISGTPPLRTRYTAANPLVMSLVPLVTAHWPRFSRDTAVRCRPRRRAAVGSQCGHGGFRG